MKNNVNFYKVLSRLYQNKLNMNHTIADVITLYESIEFTIPTLLESSTDRSGRGLTGLNKHNYGDLIANLKKVSTFLPIDYLDSKNNCFAELRLFLQFVQESEKESSTLGTLPCRDMFNRQTECWNFNKEDYADKFLNKYLQKRRSSRVEELDFSNDEDSEIEKEFVECKGTIKNSLKNVGALLFAALKIKISSAGMVYDRQTDYLASLCNLDGVIQSVYIAFYDDRDVIEYYVILFLHPQLSLVEELIPKIKSHLSENLEHDKNIEIQKLFDIFEDKRPLVSESQSFLLVDGVGDFFEWVMNSYIEPVFYLKYFGQLRKAGSYITSCTAADILLSTVDIPSTKLIVYNKMRTKFLDETKNLLIYHQNLNVNLIWNLDHLSDSAKVYIDRISIIHKENDAILSNMESHSLMVRIEVFMMTLYESAYDGFYISQVPNNARPVQFVDSMITRQLLQFSQIIKDLNKLEKLESRLRKISCSKLLAHFMQTYSQQKKDLRKKVLLHNLIISNLEHSQIREQLDELVKEYRYKQPLFYTVKDAVALKQNAIEREEQQGEELSQDPSMKLFHVRRHLSREKKVKEMLKSAMRSDVVVVRFLFEVHTSIVLDYSTYSKIFSTMLQDNKKKAPFAEMTGYLGTWQISQRIRGEIKKYSANVVMVYRAKVLKDYFDLASEIEKLWGNACVKVNRTISRQDKYEGDIQGGIQQLNIFYSSEQLNVKQIIIETRQKKLSKEFIDFVAAYMVYQDLLDTDIFQELPKWLIKKNVIISSKKRRYQKA